MNSRPKDALYPIAPGLTEPLRASLLIVGAPRSLAGDPLFTTALEQARHGLALDVRYLHGPVDPAGLMAAIAAASGEFVVVMDAAFRHHVARLADFVLPVAQRRVDVAIAARPRRGSEGFA